MLNVRKSNITDEINYTKEEVEKAINFGEVEVISRLVFNFIFKGILIPYNLTEAKLKRIATFMMASYSNRENPINVNQVYTVRDEEVYVHFANYYTGITSDYSRFIKLSGNRGLVEELVQELVKAGDISEVSDDELSGFLDRYISNFGARLDKYRTGRLLPSDMSRVKNAITSVLEVGILPQPIIVNENYEIIDGQGRFEAMKILGLPIIYNKRVGLGLRECVRMNISQSNWNASDYMISNAKEGQESFILLENIITNYKPLNMNSIGYVFYGTPLRSTDIANGKLRLDKDLYIENREYLDWCKKIANAIYGVKSKGLNAKDVKQKQKERLVCAICSIKNFANIDTLPEFNTNFENVVYEDRLLKVIPKIFSKDSDYKFQDVQSAFQSLTYHYNNNLQRPHTDFYTLYNKFCNDRDNKVRREKYN